MNKMYEYVQICNDSNTSDNLNETIIIHTERELFGVEVVLCGSSLTFAVFRYVRAGGKQSKEKARL